MKMRSHTLNDQRQTEAARLSFKIAAIYALIGSLWIFFSDGLLQQIANAPETITRLSILKGWFYVFTTGILLYVLVNRGVARIQESREALCSIEDKYQQLVRSANSIILQFDSEGRITFINEFAKQFFGYTEDEIMGKNILGTIIPQSDARGHSMAELTRDLLVHPERYLSYQNENMRSNGERVWIAWTNRALRDSHGNITENLSIGNDITQRIHMEEELRKSRDELELRVQERTAELKVYMAKLEESNRALQDFASIAAHDLQEPLRKVNAFGSMLRDKCGNSIGEQGNSYLERVLDANQRMQRLLTALLEYSRLATTSDPFTQVDLTAVVHEVLSDLEVRIHRTGGEVQVGDLPVVQADPIQMRQLFQNLIGNALKFHKDTEKPVVKVLSPAVDKGHLQIVVEDNGIGFDEQYHERVFAPFQRLHGRSGLYEGTGMGLAICRKIVERHGGTISAESEPGKGAAFIIRLPAKQSRPETACGKGCFTVL